MLHIQHPQFKLSKCYESHNIPLRTLCIPKIKISKPKANIMFLIKSKNLSLTNNY